MIRSARGALEPPFRTALPRRRRGDGAGVRPGAGVLRELRDARGREVLESPAAGLAGELAGSRLIMRERF